jgi:pimeloyl-ACP methyl ester carboxylesterase
MTRRTTPRDVPNVPDAPASRPNDPPTTHDPHHPTDLLPIPEPRVRLRPRSTGGIHLNVEIHGPDAAPTVVLIHGWTCSIPFWAPVISALRHDLRIVAYDLRGHGASDIPEPGQHSVQALVDDLTTVLDATLRPGKGQEDDKDDADEKAILVGHSMGAMTIMAAALRPSIMSRTRAALLTSTGFTELTATSRIFPFVRSPKWRTRATRRFMGSKLPLGPVNPLSRSMFKYGTLGPQASKQLATYNASIIHACTRHERAAWGQVLDHLELSDAVRHLDVPTQVLVGTVDRLTPPIHAHRIVESLPRCEGLTELPGIGHMTPLEAPDVVVDLIRKLNETPAETEVTP